MDTMKWEIVGYYNETKSIHVYGAAKISRTKLQAISQ